MVPSAQPPTGAARRRVRISDEETGRRMLAAAVALIGERGMSVSLEHLSLEEIIQAAGVARSSVYRRWPYKDLFFSDLLVELANADGELERLKNRKRSRKRSRTVDLMVAVQQDLEDFRRACGRPGDDQLVFPHELHGGRARLQHAGTQQQPLRGREHGRGQRQRAVSARCAAATQG